MNNWLMKHPLKYTNGLYDMVKAVCISYRFCNLRSKHLNALLGSSTTGLHILKKSFKSKVMI